MFYECMHMEHKYEHLYGSGSRQPRGMGWSTPLGRREGSGQEACVCADVLHSPGAGNMAAVGICPHIFHMLNIS